ncbi:MAG: type II toxin-antitoxin system VapC family toxin [Chitinophagales bacterium]|nr:type II toxin-antitoxin system VapC family toxin [Chitinophagales bacterium]
MQYLVDTHIVLWAISNEELLSGTVRDVLTDTKNELYLSVVSEWEIAIKLSLGKLQLNGTLAQLLAKIDELGFKELPIRRAHSTALIQLPFHHRDPFDRLLIAQAKTEGLTLVTGDANFKNYELELLFN